MTEGPERTTHTLTEILLDTRTTEEKVKGAAKTAPFWVIAIMGHLILVFVLGMVVLRHDAKTESNESVSGELQTDQKELKLDEKPPEEKEIERTAIPQVENTDVTEVQDQFITATDDVVNPNAQENTKFGLAEGQDDAPDNLMTMSSGGKGLAGAIGLGAGSGAGGGARKGSPLGGSRIGRRNQQAGQLQATEKVVMAGLEWLRRHQSPDGSWGCANFSINCDAKRGAQCGGRGAATFDAGVTGLALLAFLGAGFDSQRPSTYLDTVRNGLKYLKNIQDAQGCFGPTSDNRHTYAHACATIAMCEAFNSSKQLPWRKAAEQGIGYINLCQNPYKAWRYGKQPGDNDASVTGWMLMALKSAKDAGIPINDRTMKDGLAFMDSVTDEDSGRTGYIKKGEAPVRPEGMQGKFPATESESLTAVAMCSRIFCDAADSPLMKAGGELLAKKLPVWDEAKGSIDMYYWYYGTLAMFQMGGDHWDRWNKNLKTVVIDNQLKEGCTEGSWDPKDAWGDEGGRVYSTALMTLCLEVYYRYPKVFGTSGAKK